MCGKPNNIKTSLASYMYVQKYADCNNLCKKMVLEKKKAHGDALTFCNMDFFVGVANINLIILYHCSKNMQGFSLWLQYVQNIPKYLNRVCL